MHHKPIACRLREGQTLADALKDHKRQDFAWLAGSINELCSTDKPDEIIQDHKNLLLELHKSKYLLYIQNIEQNLAASHLVNKNILFTDGKMIQPQYRAVEHAIREYLQLNNLIEAHKAEITI